MVLGAAIPIVLLFLTWQGSKAPSIGAVVRPPGRLGVRELAACGTCHTLADAGSSGQVGSEPGQRATRLRDALEFITNGKGGMPSFKEQGLTDDS